MTKQTDELANELQRLFVDYEIDWEDIARYVQREVLKAEIRGINRYFNMGVDKSFIEKDLEKLQSQLDKLEEL